MAVGVSSVEFMLIADVSKLMEIFLCIQIIVHLKRFAVQ